MLADIQRRRARQSLASRPQPLVFPQLGQLDPVMQPVIAERITDPLYEEVKAQPIRMADVLVFGPLMIYSGLGRATPNWLRVGMVIIGAGTILYNLANYFEIERRAIAAGLADSNLSGMASGPMHKFDPRIHRPLVM
ncbi:MAG: hypothetical protein GTN49_10865 [candidate division Zixibacteria bacterium]|nr:hypothetical protein [candidate division Zixibacteria bacterium]